MPDGINGNFQPQQQTHTTGNFHSVVGGDGKTTKFCSDGTSSVYDTNSKTWIKLGGTSQTSQTSQASQTSQEYEAQTTTVDSGFGDDFAAEFNSFGEDSKKNFSNFSDAVQKAYMQSVSTNMESFKQECRDNINKVEQGTARSTFIGTHTITYNSSTHTFFCGGQKFTKSELLSAFGL